MNDDAAKIMQPAPQWPLMLILGGTGVILAGILVQVVDQRLGVMVRLGLDGTAFGLMARIGGPVALAGLFALTLRQSRAQPPEDEIAPPGPPPRRQLRPPGKAARPAHRVGTT